MKKLSLVFALIFFSASLALAQRTISGVVSDEKGEPLYGASVLVTGTTVGTTTDFDGKYSINVPASATSLEISYTGFTTKEVPIGASNVIDVTLEEGIQISDVVVTALGVKREKKTLGYSTQEVGGEEVTKVKDVNFVNSLSGKISGLDIKRSSTLGGSSNVIIRGSTSLMNNNQALFVVNGTPISNSLSSNDGSNGADQRTGRGGYDYGNAAMDINPEDIESITVLKGAAASALYGSRAANGVILITTKKGAKRKGIGVTFNTGVTMGNIDESTTPKYQNEYGEGYTIYRGWYGNGKGLDSFDFGNGPVLVSPTYEDASNGQKFDPNLQVADYRSFYRETGLYGKTFPFQAATNKSNTYYETAITLNNSVAFEGGNDDGNFRVSYTNFNQKGIVPNSQIKKNTITFGGDYNLTDKFTVGTNASVLITDGKGRYGTGYDSRNVNQSFRQWYNVGVDIQDQKKFYEDTKKNITWNPQGITNPSNPGKSNFFDNYYWTAYENFESDNRTRTLGNVQLTYKMNSWLNLTGRVSTDRYSEIREERIAVTSNDVSMYSRFNKSYDENNLDLFANFTKYFGTDNNVSLGGLVGFNARRQTVSTIIAQTNGGLVTPGVYALNNSVNAIAAPTETYVPRGQRGYYAQVNLGYKNMIYLDLTGRNDISSTLPKGNNSYFYPSASLSWIFSENLNTSFIDFGKLRLNYAEVGNDARAFAIKDTYVPGTPYNGAAKASISSTRNNPNLLPELTKSYEIGLDMKFLKNRAGFSISSYKANTYNQLIPLQTTASTGATFQWKNAGNIENKGIELQLNFAPVAGKDFRWDMDFTWAKNKNQVIELLEDQDNILLASVQGGITINATKGEPYGAIKGTNFVYHNGKKLVKPMPSSIDGGTSMRYVKSNNPEVIGNVNPDWKGGMTNRFSYKDISLSFLIDVQKGGDFFSLDTWYGYGTGIYDATVGTNKNGKPIRDLPSTGGGIYDDNTVLMTGTDADGNPISDGTANDKALFASDYRTAIGWVLAPNAYHVYDASYVKLRELTLTYALPKRFLGNLPVGGIDLSLVGRNLWIISKNSPYSDPEAGLSAGNIQGYQSGVYPSVKEFGVNLKVKF